MNVVGFDSSLTFAGVQFGEKLTLKWDASVFMMKGTLSVEVLYYLMSVQVSWEYHEDCIWVT